MLCVIKSQSIMFHHLTMLRKEIIISFPDSNYMSIWQSRKAALIIERFVLEDQVGTSINITNASSCWRHTIDEDDQKERTLIRVMIFEFLNLFH